MPMDKSKYLLNWDEIARDVKERANWTCQQCGLKHGQSIVRVPGSSRWYTIEQDCLYYDESGEPVDMGSLHESVLDAKETRVVMTVHHAGVPKPDGTPGDRHDKMDCRPENLVCLCQRCHWLADIDIHVEKAQKALKKRRVERIKATGQLSLWENLQP